MILSRFFKKRLWFRKRQIVPLPCAETSPSQGAEDSNVEEAALVAVLLEGQAMGESGHRLTLWWAPPGTWHLQKEHHSQRIKAFTSGVGTAVSGTLQGLFQSVGFLACPS